MDGEHNKELKRLQFYGAGPKMAGYNLDKKDDKTRGKIVNYDLDYDPVRIFIPPPLCLLHIIRHFLSS